MLYSLNQHRSHGPIFKISFLNSKQRFGGTEPTKLKEIYGIGGRER